MNGASNDRLLGKIRKLLAKAENPACTPAEAEALTAKATALIAKYGIDRALLADTDPHTDCIGDRILRMDAPYAREKAELLIQIAGPLRCRTILLTTSGAGAKTFSIHLFGFGADLDRVELLYTSLLVQAAHALAAEQTPCHKDPRAWRRTWYIGFAVTIGRRLAAAEQRAQTAAEPATTTGRSVELVLADRSALVNKATTAAYPKLDKARRRRLSGNGYRAGRRAGERADLGGTHITGTRNRELGKDTGRGEWR